MTTDAEQPADDLQRQSERQTETRRRPARPADPFPAPLEPSPN